MMLKLTSGWRLRNCSDDDNDLNDTQNGEQRQGQRQRH